MEATAKRPRGRPPKPKITKRRRALIEKILDVNVSSVSEAARLIGMHRTGAQLAMKNSAVRAEIARGWEKRLGTGDTVRGIFKKAADVVERELCHDAPDPGFALGALKVSADLSDRHPERPDERASNVQRMLAVRKVYQAMLAGALHPEILPRVRMMLDGPLYIGVGMKKLLDSEDDTMKRCVVIDDSE